MPLINILIESSNSKHSYSSLKYVLSKRKVSKSYFSFLILDNQYQNNERKRILKLPKTKIATNLGHKNDENL